jgi:hypothetical protein
MKAKISHSSKENAEELLPYPPSFIDRFMRFIQQLPVPYWLTYLVLFIFEVLVNHVVMWLTNALPTFTFSSVTLAYPLWLWGPLILMTYLNSTALKAVSNFSPLLDVTPEEIQRLKYEFTTMPARSVIINELIWFGIYVFYLPLIVPTYVTSGFEQTLIIYSVIIGLGPFLIGSVILYQTVRQLKLVHRTVKVVKQFDLFNLNPVNALSALTSRTGIAWIILPSITLLFQNTEHYLALVLLLLGVVLALVAFVLPMWVVHKRLVEEKRLLLAQHGQRVKVTLARLHRSVDENELDDVKHLRYVLDGLTTESNILEKIRTWPWSTETLTGFLSALGLPIILLLIQIAIQKWLNL